jgi:hypothetical protein
MPSLLGSAKTASRSSTVPSRSRLSLCPCRPRVVLDGSARRGGGPFRGSFGHAVDSPQSPWRCTAPRLSRQEAAEALTSPRALPLPACSGLRPRWPLPCLAASDSADTACQRTETVRGSHTHGAGVRGWLSLAGPRRSNNFRGSLPTLLTCSTRLLTFVASRQRVVLPGWWLAGALGRTCTSWGASTAFIEVANLESQQLRVELVTTVLCWAVPVAYRPHCTSINSST